MLSLVAAFAGSAGVETQVGGVRQLGEAPQPSGALSEPNAVLFDPFLSDLEERTFRFFWETANPKNGLIPDRYPTPSFASIAAVGFGLTAYPIGVERGYVTRAAAVPGQGEEFPSVRGARRGRRPHRRRRHHRPDRRDQLAAVRSGDRAAGNPRDVPPLRLIHLFLLRVAGCVQCELSQWPGHARFGHPGVPGAPNTPAASSVWVDPDYLGIDEGPILAMIENYRSDLIWRVMRSDPYVRQRLDRAGFSGGWLEAHGP